MSLHEMLDTAHQQYLNEFSIRSTFMSIKNYPKELIKKKVLNSWGDVKKELDDDEKKQKFLDFIDMVVGKKFNSIAEVDALFNTLKESTTFDDIKKFTIKNAAAILSFAGLLLEVSLKIAGHTHIALALLYTILSILMLIWQNDDKISEIMAKMKPRIKLYLEKVSTAMAIVGRADRVVKNQKAFNFKKQVW